MKASTRKALRDLARQKGQVIGVGITIMLGVSMYVLTGGAYLNLDASYHQTYDRLNFASLVATGGQPDTVAEAATTAGAPASSTRTQLDVPLEIRDTKLLGRVVSIPGNGSAPIDNVDILTGSRTLGQGNVFLEYHAAQAFGLEAGDDLRIYTPSGWETARVAATVESPEYIWPARSRQDVFPDPQSFAVAWVAEATLRDWYGPDTANQALALLPTDASSSELDRIAGAMKRAGATDVVTWEDQASNATLTEDLDGFRMMSIAFPALFLLAAGVAAYVLQARRILQERPIIGTLLAQGAHPGRLLWHYVFGGLVIGVTASVVGVVVGSLGAGAATSGYTGILGIPDTVIEVHPQLVVGGIVFGFLVGVLGALGPALSAARTSPAAAMQPVAPSVRPGPWSRFVARLTWIPVSGRMALRDIGRSRRRTFATALGAVLSMVLVLASVGMMTSMVAAVDQQFGTIDTTDATVAVAPGTSESVIADTPGIAHVEQVAAGAVTVEANGSSYKTTLTGYESGTRVHTFLNEDGDPIPVPSTGVLASAGLASALDVRVGDTLTLTSNGENTTVVLEGFVTDAIGSALYSTLAVAESALGDADVTVYATTFTAGADRGEIRDHLTSETGVVAYSDNQAIKGLLDQYMGLFWAFILLMVGLGAVLALTVMYVTMAVNIVERTGELATLRASGVKLGRVASVIATENLAATAIGVPFGLLFGVIAARQLLAMYSDDLFQFALSWPWWVPVVVALGMLLAAVASVLPARRAIRAIDVARVVRERAA